MRRKRTVDDVTTHVVLHLDRGTVIAVIERAYAVGAEIGRDQGAHEGLVSTLRGKAKRTFWALKSRSGGKR